jgi:hypothetical protein
MLDAAMVGRTGDSLRMLVGSKHAIPVIYSLLKQLDDSFCCLLLSRTWKLLLDSRICDLLIGYRMV